MIETTIDTLQRSVVYLHKHIHAITHTIQSLNKHIGELKLEIHQ